MLVAQGYDLQLKKKMDFMGWMSSVAELASGPLVADSIKMYKEYVTFDEKTL